MTTTIPFSIPGLKALLAVESDTLAVAVTRINLNASGTVIVGTAPLFDNAAQAVTITTSVEQGQLKQVLQFQLNTLSLSDLMRYQLVPLMVASPSMGSLQFTTPNFQIDIAQRHLTVTAAVATDPLSFGLDTLKVSQPKLNLTRTADENDVLTEDQPLIVGQWAFANGTPVAIQFPVNGFDWLLALPEGQTQPLGDSLTSLTTFLNSDPQQFLPLKLPGLGAFSLQQIAIRFNADPPTLRSAAMTIGTTKSYPIIPSKLEITALQVQLGASYNTNAQNQPITLLSGHILGQAQVLGALTSLQIPLPANQGDWLLEVYPNLSTPSLADLTTRAADLLATGTQLTPALPTNFSGVGALTVTYLGITFNPSLTPVLKALKLAFGTAEPWVIVAGYPSLQELNVNLEIADPLGDPALAAQILGIINITDDVNVYVTVSKPLDDDGWSLSLEVHDLVLPSVTDIAQLIGGADAADALPEGLKQIEGITLSELAVAFDLTNQKVLSGAFTILSPNMWSIVEGYFEIGDLLIQLAADYTTDPNGQLTGEIGGTLAIGEVGFVLRAIKATPDEPWVFTGAMREGDVVDFTALLNSLIGHLLSANFQLPAGFPSVRLVAADTSYTPATGDFMLHGSAEIGTQWNIPLGQAQLPVAEIAATLTVTYTPAPPTADEDPPAPVRHYTLAVDGIFRFNGLYAQVRFVTGDTTTDTILYGLLTNDPTVGPVANPNLPSLVNGLASGTQNQTKTWADLVPAVPADLGSFGVVSGSLAINLTQKVFMLYGQAAAFGAVALLFAQQENQWRFLVAVQLKENFTFASVWPALASIDSILLVKKASFVIADFSAAAMQTVIQAFPTTSSGDLPSPQDQLSSIVQLPALAAGGTATNVAQVRAGVNFYAALDFPAMHSNTTPNPQGKSSAIFANILEIMPAAETQADLTLYGFVNQQQPEQTVFKAWFGTYTLFSVLEFSGIQLAYYPNKASELQLQGQLTLIFGQGPDSQYPFEGALTINQTALTATITTPPDKKIQAPLGMVGITFQNLGLFINHPFGQNAPPTILAISGQVGFGVVPPPPQPNPPPPTPKLLLNGYIYWIGGSPVLVAVELAQPLPIFDFFATIFTGQTYSPSFEITLQAGSIYYYAGTTALTFQNQTYRPGFNIHCVITLFSIDVTIDVQVLHNQTLSGYPAPQSGIIVSGAFGQPISLWFLKLSDSTFTTAPALQLRSLTNCTSFGLDCGLSLFNERFATGSIGVGKSAQGEAQLEAKLQYAGEIALLKHAELAFTYSKSQGFQLTHLPFSTEIALDFKKALQAIQDLGGDECSELVNLTFQQLIKTNFYLKPKMRSDPANEATGDLQVDLDGIYSIALLEASSPFLYVNMPTLHLTIKETDNLTLSGLPQFLIDNILSNSASVLEQMINDPVKWAAFVSVVSAEALAKKLITEALCEPEEATEEATEATEEAEAAESASTAAEATEKAEAGMAAAAGAGGGLEAAGAATAGVLAAVGEGAVGVFAHFIKSIFGGSSDSHPTKPGSLAAVSNLKLAYKDGLKVTWQASDQTALKNQWFKVQLYNQANKMGTQFIYGAEKASFAQPPASGQFYVEITAYALGYKPSQTVTSGTMQQLPPPALNALTLTGTTVTATLTQNLAAGQTAQAQLIINGQVSGSAQPMRGQPATASFAVPANATSVQVQAQLLSPDFIPSAWQSAPNPITQLAPPALQPLTVSGNTITVTLQSPVPGAASYQAQLVADGKPVGAASSMTTTTAVPPVTQAQFTVTDTTPGTTFQVQVWAVGANDLPSAITTSTDSIPRLAAPVLQAPAGANSALSFSNQTVSITLQANVAQALQYQVQFLNAANEQAVGAVLSVAVTATPVIDVPTATLPAGTYKVQVQALGAPQTTLASLWVTSAASVFVVGTIALNQLGYSANTLSAAWVGDDQATSYNFELRSPTATVLAHSVGQPNPQTPAPTSAQIPVPATVPLGALYTGYVQMLANGQTGPWSAGVTVVLLDVPQGLTLTYAGNQVSATWQSVSMATGYTVEIRGATPDQTRSASTPTAAGGSPPPTTLTVDVTGLPVGAYTGVVKATAQQLASEWSAPITFVLLAAPAITSLAYAANFITLAWSPVPAATSYHVELHTSPDTAPVAAAEILPVGTAPPATTTKLDLTTLAKGVLYLARVNAGIAAGPSAWSQTQTVLALDVPTLVSANLTPNNQLALVWLSVAGASSYDFQVTDSNHQPTPLVVPSQPATSEDKQTNTIDLTTLAAGTYNVQVRANSGSLKTAWSAALAFTIQRSTPDQMAAQLHTQQVLAPNAAPQLMRAFPDQFANHAPALVTLLQAHFPESTKTLTQLAWALANSPYTVDLATQTLSAQANTSLAEVIAAIKAAYPAPAVQQQIAQLSQAQATPAQAAQQIYAAHSDITTLQMAVLLTMHFASGVQTPTAMAQALYQAGYDSVSAMSALAEIYPLATLADFIAAIRSAYPQSAEAMAQRLHTEQVIAPDAAPRIKQIFAAYQTDPGGLLTLLRANFPESTTTPTQLAWALSAAGYPATEATPALEAVQPAPDLATLLGALKAAYPPPALQQQIGQLAQQNASVTEVAAQIHTANPDIDALQMAVLLMLNFRPLVPTPLSLAQALQNAAYSKTEAASALAQVFPLNPPGDLSNALNQAYT